MSQWKTVTGKKKENRKKGPSAENIRKMDKGEQFKKVSELFKNKYRFYPEQYIINAGEEELRKNYEGRSKEGIEMANKPIWKGENGELKGIPEQYHKYEEMAKEGSNSGNLGQAYIYYQWAAQLREEHGNEKGYDVGHENYKLKLLKRTNSISEIMSKSPEKKQKTLKAIELVREFFAFYGCNPPYLPVL